MRPVLSASFVLTLLTVAGLTAVTTTTGSGTDAAIRAALQAATPQGEIDRRVEAALGEGDVALADQYRVIGEDLGKPVSTEVAARLEEAQSLASTVVRNVTDFASAYVTGSADTSAGLAGAIVSDLTVVGDVRDVISEGGKAAVGADYSRFLLALATVGIAAEGAIIATGGSSLPLKLGASILKAAKRSGNLTVEFARYLARQIETVARAPAPTRGAVRVGAGPAGAAAPALARLARAYQGVGSVAANAGAAESVRLMRYVRTGDDLENVARMSGRFGPRTRAVIELTGKTSLRGFRFVLKAGRIVLWAVLSLLSWLAGLLLFGVARRALRWLLRRLPFTAGHGPARREPRSDVGRRDRVRVYAPAAGDCGAQGRDRAPSLGGVGTGTPRIGARDTTHLSGSAFPVPSIGKRLSPEREPPLLAFARSRATLVAAVERR